MVTCLFFLVWAQRPPSGENAVPLPVYYDFGNGRRNGTTNVCYRLKYMVIFRGGSRTAATSKTDRFVIIVNCWKLLTIITKCSIFDVAAVLDPPLILISSF